VPAIVRRFLERTSEGYVGRDLGLDVWLFAFDQEKDLKKLAPAVVSMSQDRDATMQKVAKARACVESRQRETMGVLNDCSPVLR